MNRPNAVFFGFRRSLILYALASLVACASAPAPAPQEAVTQATPVTPNQKEDPLGNANERFARGDFDAALQRYEQVLAREPKNPTAGYNRAVTLQKLGKTDQAVEAYEALVKAQPKNEDAVLNLGAALRDQGRVDQAIEVYQHFLKKQPHSSRVLNNLALLFRTKKQYAKAVEVVRKLLMRDQKNVDAYKNLALIHYDQGKYVLARTILGNAVKMAKEQKAEDADIQVNLGLIELALGENGPAMVSFKEAVRIAPKHVLAHYNIGAIALAHRDYDQAAKSFEIVSAVWPNDFEVVSSLGYAYQGQQKWSEASKQLAKARAIKQDESVLAQLAAVSQSANELDKALAYVNELLRVKNKECHADELDGVCGRKKGLELMIKQAKEPPGQPDKKSDFEKKPKGGNVEIFKEGPAEDEPPPPTPPAEGEGSDSGTVPQPP